jgi:hypothetical protein
MRSLIEIHFMTVAAERRMHYAGIIKAALRNPFRSFPLSC